MQNILNTRKPPGATLRYDGRPPCATPSRQLSRNGLLGSKTSHSVRPRNMFTNKHGVPTVCRIHPAIRATGTEPAADCRSVAGATRTALGVPVNAKGTELPSRRSDNDLSRREVQSPWHSRGSGPHSGHGRDDDHRYHHRDQHHHHAGRR